MKLPRHLSRIVMVLLLMCKPLGSSPLSLSHTPSSQSISSKVGHRTVLPCDWKPRLQVTPPTYHVQWQNQLDTVLEQWGQRRYEAPEFQQRLEVQKEEKLEAGDCSLIINDVQMGDAGHYESFMVVDSAPSEKTRVFIDRVKLLVYDHNFQVVKAPGENLELQLHTRLSVRVIFQSRNSSQWSSVWVREGESEEEEEEEQQQQQQNRVVKDPLKEQLTIMRVTVDDRGTYKVLDPQGLAISTTRLSIQDKSFGDGEERAAMGNPALSGGSSRHSHWTRFPLFLLAAALLALLHLILQ